MPDDEHDDVEPIMTPSSFRTAFLAALDAAGIDPLAVWRLRRLRIQARYWLALAAEDIVAMEVAILDLDLLAEELAAMLANPAAVRAMASPWPPETPWPDDGPLTEGAS